MTVTVVPANRSSGDGTMAVGTMIGQFLHQGLVEEKARNAFVSEMHTKVRSITNGHNLVLQGIKMQTDSFVDMITESKEISESFVAMSTSWVPIGGVPERIIKIFLSARDLMMFP